MYGKINHICAGRVYPAESEPSLNFLSLRESFPPCQKFKISSVTIGRTIYFTRLENSTTKFNFFSMLDCNFASSATGNLGTAIYEPFLNKRRISRT
jgi:hypothetical protein